MTVAQREAIQKPTVILSEAEALRSAVEWTSIYSLSVRLGEIDGGLPPSPIGSLQESSFDFANPPLRMTVGFGALRVTAHCEALSIIRHRQTAGTPCFG